MAVDVPALLVSIPMLIGKVADPLVAATLLGGGFSCVGVTLLDVDAHCGNAGFTMFQSHGQIQSRFFGTPPPTPPYKQSSSYSSFSLTLRRVSRPRDPLEPMSIT